MPEAISSPVKSSGFRRLVSEAFFGVLIVVVLAALFFAFYVQPQSKFERDRIYRSMNQVSRLIDDRTEIAAQAARFWGSNAKSAQSLDTPGLKVGCSGAAEICVSYSQNTEGNDNKSGAVEKPPVPNSPKSTISASIDFIATKASLPYPEAILLIMDSKGNVLAGHDRDDRWRQFQTLKALIVADRLQAGGKTGPSAGTDPWDQADRAIKLAQRYGRGEENPVFEGYPARLSRNIGGQGYAIFLASHQLRPVPSGDASSGTVSISVGEATAEGSVDPKAEPQLLFAYLVPERVIDWSSVGISPSAIVNMLLGLISLLLAVPFLKLFNQNPVKPIRVVDLAAVMIALMMITMTATLFVTVTLMRSSVTRDIDTELSFLSDRASKTVGTALGQHTFDSKGFDDPHARSTAVSDKGALLGVVPITANGTCIARGSETQNLGGKRKCAGLWFNDPPAETDFSVKDRAYYVAWRDRIFLPGGNYVQFLRAKGTGMLSWSRIEGASRDWGAGNLVTTVPIGLRAPVLPRNFSFMIVLNTDLPQVLTAPGSARLGDVQYHTDESRSLVENVVDEARRDGDLATALQLLRVRSSGSDRDRDRSEMLAINYHGRSHFAVVRPIKDTPWSVVALYDRTEALAFLSQSVVQTFVIGCLWILGVLLTCWILPRALHLKLRRLRSEADTPLRGRSIWFFPNALYEVTPNGWRYTFDTRADEVLLQLVALSLQTTALLFLSSGMALAIICAISLVILAGHYIMVARPPGSQDEPIIVSYRILNVVVLAAAALFIAVFPNPSSSPGWIAFFGVVAVIIVANFLQNKRQFQRSDEKRAIVAVRRSFIGRGIALLVLTIGVPTVGFLTFTYSVNLERYVGASLVTVAERAAAQKRMLQADARINAGTEEGENKDGTKTKSEDRGFGDYVNWVKVFDLDKYDRRNKGWFLSGPGDHTSGIFSIRTSDKKARQPQSSGLLTSFIDQMAPQMGDRSAKRYGYDSELVSSEGPLGGFVLESTDQFQPFRNDLANRHGNDPLLTQAPPLAGGKTGYLPFEPRPLSVLIACVFVGVFLVCFYYLTRSVAAYLTGLYVNRVDAPPGQEEKLNALIALDPALAWQAVGSDGKRARLMALAFSRTINFSDRKPVQELVESGYLVLTPYVRLANDQLAEYIRFDLPREERQRVQLHCSSADDKWEHMRLPIFIALGLGCILIAYTSPSAVQLVTSSFLALAALLPLSRDPMAQIFGRKI